jgi:signal transduction histidine kinase/ActR/RegA family two-component response regulator
MTALGPEQGVAALAVGPGLAPACAALARIGLRATPVDTTAQALPLLSGRELVLISFRQPIAPILSEAPEIPLVVLDAPPPALTGLLQAGAVDAFCAPLDPDLLIARVGALLSLLRKARASAQHAADEARQKAEDAQRQVEQASRLKDQFLSTLSHEMRTPLTAILGWVSLLRLGKASADPAGRALETIERNARLQARLVGDLLDVQRIASGKMSLSFRDTELGMLLLAALQGVEPSADEAGVVLQVTRPLDEELHVFGDPERLHQVFSSLLSNAVKFSERGGRVRVHLQPFGNEASILFQDQGRGFDPAFLSQMFEPFTQQEGGLSRDKRGMGVGLSLVRHLVEMHGGTVSGESDGVGKGARFTVSLPISARVARPAARPSRPVESRPVRSDLQDLRILVVEDDVDTQHLLMTLLEQLGARVTTAGSAAEAVVALQAKPFDLLLSDISMPGEDGYSLIRRVRAGPIQTSIPAAALTANAAPADRAKALVAGFDTHIAKPVEPLELAHLLSSLARRQG